MDVAELIGSDTLKKLNRAAKKAADGEDTATQVAYFKLNPQCAYCQKPAEAIRVTIPVSGQIAVATLCKDHAFGEARHSVEKDGFVAVWPGSRFVNPDIYGDVPEGVRAVPFYEQDEEPK